MCVDIVLGEWSDTVDASGSKTRSNTFTIALHASFGPKTTPSCETQVFEIAIKPHVLTTFSLYLRENKLHYY